VHIPESRDDETAICNTITTSYTSGIRKTRTVVVTFVKAGSSEVMTMPALLSALRGAGRRQISASTIGGDAMAKAEMSILPDVTSDPTHNKTIVDRRFTKGVLSRGWYNFITHEVIDKEKRHLKDDCLTILCDVTVTEPSTADHIEDPMPEDKAIEPRTCYVSNLVSRSDRG
jgi:hypothetical protein